MHSLKSYEAAKETFQCIIGVAREHYKICEHHSDAYDDKGILTTETVYLSDTESPEKLLILTAGMHGVEGFVGAELVNRTITRHYKEMNSSKTALLVINFINPWGMKYFRRVNRENIDLNRNFIHPTMPERIQSQAIFDLIDGKWQGRLRPLNLIRYYFSLIRCIIVDGIQNTNLAIFGGQYDSREQIYYGGQCITDENKNVLKWIDHYTADSVKQIVHFDLHTGYGPKYELTLINSSFDALNPFLWKRNLKLDHVEIRDVYGDMVDYLYKVDRDKYRDVFHTCVEFGTLGHSVYHRFESLRVTILENEIWQKKITHQKTSEKILKKFINIYCPLNEKWWQKVEADFDGLIKNAISYFIL